MPLYPPEMEDSQESIPGLALTCGSPAHPSAYAAR